MIRMGKLIIDVDHKEEALESANYDPISCHKLSSKSNFGNADDNYSYDRRDKF